ncbi:hypothetical protein ATJ97_1515 [Georgenia soli]|uniref:Rubredoxin n=1 Tax=Georgenia soli TaxID=638953 RepID=A0A2A9ELA8_9MICO|nr:hypothetical protein ATJ97_1515 [Georgenia soli]
MTAYGRRPAELPLVREDEVWRCPATGAVYEEFEDTIREVRGA